MNLLENTKNERTKENHGENVSHLEITEAVLVHQNLIGNNYQQNSRVFYTFVPNKSLVNY